MLSPAFYEIQRWSYTSSLLMACAGDTKAFKAKEHPWPLVPGSAKWVHEIGTEITPFDPPHHEKQLRVSGGKR